MTGRAHKNFTPSQYLPRVCVDNSLYGALPQGYESCESRCLSYLFTNLHTQPPQQAQERAEITPKLPLASLPAYKGCSRSC